MAIPAFADDIEGKPDAVRLRMLAALTLNKCAREREAHAKPSYDCLGDVAEAKRVAAEKNLPICVWVGGCDPASRIALDAAGIQAVHVHVNTWGAKGDTSPRLVIPVSDTAWCEIPHKEITPTAVQMRLPSIAGASIVPASTPYRIRCSGGSCSIVTN